MKTQRKAKFHGHALSPRHVALTVVDAVMQSDKETATDWLDQHFQRFSVPWRDRALITELVYGTLRRSITLDWIISHYTFHRVKDHVLKNILRLAVYQIYFLERVPAYAAVNEMVQITKDRMGDAKARFVNAVLRRAAQRDIPVTEAKISKMSGIAPLKALSVAHAMPLWLLERWKKAYSWEQMREICEASNSAPEIFVRVNTLKAMADDLKELLERDGAQAEFVTDRLLKVRPAKSLSTMETFRAGMFYVQDPTTLRIVDFLDPRPGERILDMCGAPGGKAFYMEEKAGEGAIIVAAEKNSARLRLAMDNAKRLGSKVRWIIADALRIESAGKFDKILLDVPCSNQGVLSRRVEARLRITPEKIDRLRHIQKELLAEALPLVSASGAVYYSTCSIDPAENEDLVAEFLSSHRSWGCAAKLSLLPLAGKHDGGFVAKLVRAPKKTKGA